MARIPISIEKIKVEQSSNSREVDNETGESVKYLVSIFEKNESWNRSILADRNELIKFRDEINLCLEKTTTAEVLKISKEKARIVDDYYSKDPLCESCKLKLTFNCKTCLFGLQSPLERKLFLELSKTRIRFQTQYALNWQGENISIEGKTYNHPQNNFKDVLTIVDFYVERRDTKLCIYTDGHTYHERTEEQAQRDRNIDRKLQELGYQVLRYTGKDVKENIGKIIQDIEKWVG
jgi:hypothetical protein